jgi:toxin ParE1/3/4
MKLVVAAAARQDLQDIARYTEEIWGAAPRKRYVEAIRKRFALIRRRPHVGARRDEIRLGYRSISSGRHVIFYRLAEDVVEIVRVLHGNMDLHRHLDPSAKGPK